MTRIDALIASVLLASLAACGGSSTPAQAPEPASESSAQAAGAAPAAKPEEPAPSADASPGETLARDLVKAGGRRIG